VRRARWGSRRWSCRAAKKLPRGITPKAQRPRRPSRLLQLCASAALSSMHLTSSWPSRASPPQMRLAEGPARCSPIPASLGRYRTTEPHRLVGDLQIRTAVRIWEALHDGQRRRASCATSSPSRWPRRISSPATRSMADQRSMASASARRPAYASTTVEPIALPGGPRSGAAEVLTTKQGDCHHASPFRRPGRVHP
jgi:hypothetical protein